MTTPETLLLEDARRWVRCPGSVSLSRLYPGPATEGPVAAENTALHFVIDRMFQSITEHLAEAPNGVAITPALVADAAECVSHARANRTARLWYAEPVAAASIHEHTEGTVDAFCFDTKQRTAQVWLFDYAWVALDPFEDYRLLGYASAVADLIARDIGAPPVDYTYTLTVVQPRAWHPEGVARSWVVAASELSHHVRHMRTAAEEAESDNPSTGVGQQCKRCPGRRACPALREASLDAVDAVFDATPVDLPPVGLALELSLLQRARDAIEVRLSGLEAQAFEAIRQGSAVPGWSIEHGPGRDEWTVPLAEIEAVSALTGVVLTKEVQSITPAQAKAAGLSADVVAAYTRRKPGAAKLKQTDPAAARKAFGGTRNPT